MRPDGTYRFALPADRRGDFGPLLRSPDSPRRHRHHDPDGTMLVLQQA
jgi:hypothetical protein